MATTAENTQQINAISKYLNELTAQSKFAEELTAESSLETSSIIAVRFDDGSGYSDYFVTVQQMIDLISVGYNIVNTTTDYTAIANDFILANATSNNIVITLPDATLNISKEINIKRIDNSNYSIVIDTTSSQTIDNELTQTILGQYTNATIISNGSNWFIK